MNNIDAIEGTIKSVIFQLHHQFIDHLQDDTEYARNIKAVLGGVQIFLDANREVAPQSDVVIRVLYGFAKDLWRSRLTAMRTGESAADTAAASENEGYDDYYFDYIYTHGVYPP